MKHFRSYTMIAILAILTTVISACGAATPAPLANRKIELQSRAANTSTAAEAVAPVNVEFTGTIQGIQGNQWIINGQTVTADPQAVNGANFHVGDAVRVRGTVDQNGVIVASRMGDPASFAQGGLVMASDANPSGTPSSSSDDNENENEDYYARGTLQAMNGNMWTIDGKDYVLGSDAEIHGNPQVGDMLKIEYYVASDGTMTITEAKVMDTMNSNSNDDDDDDHSWNSNNNSNQNGYDDDDDDYEGGDD